MENTDPESRDILPVNSHPLYAYQSAAEGCPLRIVVACSMAEAIRIINALDTEPLAITRVGMCINAVECDDEG